MVWHCQDSGKDLKQGVVNYNLEQHQNYSQLYQGLKQTLDKAGKYIVVVGYLISSLYLVLD